MAKYSLLNQDIDTSFLNIETTWTGMRSSLIKKQIGFSIPDSFCELVKGTTLNYFQDKKQAEAFSHICAQSVIKNKKLLTEIKQRTEVVSHNFFQEAKKLYPLPKLKDEELSSILIKNRILQQDLAAWGMVVAFADVYGEISDQIMSIFTQRKNLKFAVSDYLEILSNPIKPSCTASAYQDIQASKNIKDILKKYFWLDQGYIGRGLTMNQIKEIKSHATEHKKKNSLTRAKALKELKLSNREINLLEIFSQLVYIKSLRSDARQALYVVTNNIIDYFAGRLSISTKYLEAMSTNELVDVISGKTNLPKDIYTRWKRSLIIPLSLDTYKIVSDNAQIDKFLNAKIDVAKKQLDGIAELTGQVAQPGKVKGKVRLIFGPQHNNKVKKGDILVSVSTSPQLLPAMKLAAAFVTDMGGITSHAAIVSRELKTPCIVGTKIATKILKDGDMVEIDANKGVVRIIR